MRAAVLHGARGVPTIGQVDDPTAPAGGILVAVPAAEVNPHESVPTAGIREASPVPDVPGTEGVGTRADGSRADLATIDSPSATLVLVP